MELRKYGFLLVMLATRPTLISPNVLSNCGTLVSHMLTSERDVDAVVEHLVATDERRLKEEIRTLRTGNAMVQTNFPQPERPRVYRIGLFEHFIGLGLAEPEEVQEPSVAPAVGPPTGLSR